jgi:hypothetical protein
VTELVRIGSTPQYKERWNAPAQPPLDKLVMQTDKCRIQLLAQSMFHPHQRTGCKATAATRPHLSCMAAAGCMLTAPGRWHPCAGGFVARHERRVYGANPPTRNHKANYVIRCLCTSPRPLKLPDTTPLPLVGGCHCIQAYAPQNPTPTHHNSLPAPQQPPPLHGQIQQILLYVKQLGVLIRSNGCW